MLKGAIGLAHFIFAQKHLIAVMAKRELAEQYVGAFLGVIWKIIHPIILITIFWVIFSLGFKVQPTHGVPFVSWLTAGMAIWFAFADIVSGATQAIVKNPNLIKKTLFPSQILPIVKLIVGIVTHSIFLLVLLVLIIFQDITISWYNLQFLYYLTGMSLFALGLGWMLSAFNVFVRDVDQVVPIILQIGFWATPIFWNLSMIPPKLQFIFKLNPMYYIVEGYRQSFIYAMPFWQHPYQTLYFWSVSLTTLYLGALIFKKLKPHFADSL